MSVGSDIVVTRNVKRRLSRIAQAEIPLTRRDRLADQASHVLVWVFLGGIFAYDWLDIDFGVHGFFVLCAWVSIMVFIGSAFSDWAGEERLAAVNARVAALAEERQRRIDEADAFYASAEWKLLRDEVIKDQGRVCRDCGITIRNDADVTVDHIQPRSKYPDLALARDNLRVLCRSCNSKKGDR